MLAQEVENLDWDNSNTVGFIRTQTNQLRNIEDLRMELSTSSGNDIWMNV